MEAAWGLDLSWKRFGPGRTLGGEGVAPERVGVSAWSLAALVVGGLVVVCVVLGFLFVQRGSEFSSAWLSGIGMLQPESKIEAPRGG